MIATRSFLIAAFLACALLVPMSEVRGFEAPSGPCPYAAMRCIEGVAERE